MLIGIDSLHRLFAQYPGKKKIQVTGICQDCGCDLNIEIHATSGGFGMQNGALFEPKTGVFCSKCAACYGKQPDLLDCDESACRLRIV